MRWTLLTICVMLGPAITAAIAQEPQPNTDTTIPFSSVRAKLPKDGETHRIDVNRDNIQYIEFKFGKNSQGQDVPGIVAEHRFLAVQISWRVKLQSPIFLIGDTIEGWASAKLFMKMEKGNWSVELKELQGDASKGCTDALVAAGAVWFPLARIPAAAGVISYQNVKGALLAEWSKKVSAQLSEKMNEITGGFLKNLEPFVGPLNVNLQKGAIRIQSS